MPSLPLHAFSVPELLCALVPAWFRKVAIPSMLHLMFLTIGTVSGMLHLLLLVSDTVPGMLHLSLLAMGTVPCMLHLFSSHLQALLLVCST